LHAAARVAVVEAINAALAADLNDILSWLSENLCKTDRCNRTTSNGFYRGDAKGLSWFEPTVNERHDAPRSLFAECDDDIHKTPRNTTIFVASMESVGMRPGKDVI